MRTENIVIGARSLVRDSLCVNGKGSQRVMRAKVLRIATFLEFHHVRAEKQLRVYSYGTLYSLKSHFIATTRD
jgi:hypothetical protein